MDTPWHLWLVGLFALIWTGFGAADYVMSRYEYGPYVAMFTPEQLAFFENFPAWAQGTWAIAVWASLVGAVMLLLRSKVAGLLFGLAIIFMVATFARNFLMVDPPIHVVLGPAAMYFAGATLVVALFLWIYARAMRQAGVLD